MDNNFHFFVFDLHPDIFVAKFFSCQHGLNMFQDSGAAKTKSYINSQATLSLERLKRHTIRYILQGVIQQGYCLQD